MKQGITVERSYNYRDQLITTVKKRRGKLTLEEVTDALRYGGDLNGHYVIVLNCSEATIGGDDFMDWGDGPQGDALDLFKLEEGDFCPVCGEITPLVEYCPNCGQSWKDPDKTIEILLASMKAETTRGIQNAKNRDGRAAWYWTYIGALDMAQQIGAINDARRQLLYAEAADLKEAIGKE